jgi:hypothetical protein
MSEYDRTCAHYCDIDNLPEMFPTHRHHPEFWEALGRTIATFGFLEEILGKSIFALTATRRYHESEIEEAYKRWLPTLERALTDPLKKLIDSYEKAVRAHSDATINTLDELLDKLRASSEIRNVLCHGSWRLPPDNAGKSVPFFIDWKKRIFTTPVDISYLQRMQRHVAELACDVMNSVTVMGYQFPGSNGPGRAIW